LTSRRAKHDNTGIGATCEDTILRTTWLGKGVILQEARKALKSPCRCALFPALAGLFGFAALAGTCEGFRLERVLPAVQQCYGGNAAAVATDWNHILTLFHEKKERAKLHEINLYINRKLRAESDLKIWGQKDYWSTPIEALMKECGDCDDYAIAKYFSLKYAGVPVSRLRLTYVKALIGKEKRKFLQAHMVLTYYPAPDAEPLVLDNMADEICPASQRTDLVPIFSFNAEGVWRAGVPQPNGGNHLSMWTGVVEKMKNEGFD